MRVGSTRRLIAVALCGAGLLTPAACSRQDAGKDVTQSAGQSPSSPMQMPDICGKLSNEEFSRILGVQLTKTHRSENNGGGFVISHCRFETVVASDSITVTATRSAPGSGGHDPKKFLEERIEEYEKREGTGKGEKGEAEKPLDFVPDLGDKALWIGTMVGGDLYILKDHVLIRVSIGTTKDHTQRRAKAIALARLVVARL